MARKRLEWSTYAVPVSPNSVFLRQQRAWRDSARHAAPPTSASGGVAGVAAEDQPAAEEGLTVDIPLPDLSAFPTATQKASVLLATAAEIEHALMVQYLYAAYSLKDRRNAQEVGNLTPSQKGALAKWMLTLLEIAREEMGHLMTVQNLLLFVGEPPNFEREDFPPAVDFYPFKLHLEPLTQRSLAKYVVAESPTETTGLEDIIALAVEHAQMPINHVGVLYALLGMVFSTEPEVVNGGSGSAAWDEAVRDVAHAAYQQNPDRSAWHLQAAAFHPENMERQGDPGHWTHGGDQVRVHRVVTRADVRNAIRDIGEQGEGPGNGAQPSHFERFTQMFRGAITGEPFPASDGWIPTRAVPTDPRADAFVAARTRRWADLFDTRYGFLLGLLEHYLLITGPDRLLFVGWMFAEMRSHLAYIARFLTTLNIDGAGRSVAAAPFMLPTQLHLPGTEPERWRLHRERVDATLTRLDDLLTDPLDASDAFLLALRDSERGRREYIEKRLAGESAGLSFGRDIRPMFRLMNDIPHMTAFGLDLSDHASVSEMADRILEKLKGVDPAGQIMPPPPLVPWTPGQVELFERWVAEQKPA